MPIKVLVLETSPDQDGLQQAVLLAALKHFVHANTGLVERAVLFDGADTGDMARDEDDGVLRIVGVGNELLK
jgi:hypothetical protein